MFTVKTILILCIIIGILMYLKDHLHDINVCERCEGEGYLGGGICPYCQGTGKKFNNK